MLVREMQTVSGSLTPTATYFQGAQGPLYRRDDTQSEGTYTSGGTTYAAGKTRWYVYDGLGSVVGEVDPSGDLTSSGTYDVYGAKRAGGSTGTATTRQGFVGRCGHVTDTETGLVYMRARYYDPGTGRFISEDVSKDGANWFEYSIDNPVRFVDPDGKSPADQAFYAGIGAFLAAFLGSIIADGQYGNKIHWVNAWLQGIVWGVSTAAVTYLIAIKATINQTLDVLKTAGRLVSMGVGAVLVVAMAAYAAMCIAEMFIDAADEVGNSIQDDDPSMNPHAFPP